MEADFEAFLNESLSEDDSGRESGPPAKCASPDSLPKKWLKPNKGISPSAEEPSSSKHKQPSNLDSESSTKAIRVPFGGSLEADSVQNGKSVDAAGSQHKYPSKKIDTLLPDSSGASSPRPITVEPGEDTLQELEDKAAFFHDLKGDASGTLDYNELNQLIGGIASPKDVPNANGHKSKTQVKTESEGEAGGQSSMVPLLSKVSLLDTSDTFDQLKNKSSPEPRGFDLSPAPPVAHDTPGSDVSSESLAIEAKSSGDSKLHNLPTVAPVTAKDQQDANVSSPISDSGSPKGQEVMTGSAMHEIDFLMEQAENVGRPEKGILPEGVAEATPDLVPVPDLSPIVNKVSKVIAQGQVIAHKQSSSTPTVKQNIKAHVGHLHDSGHKDMKEPSQSHKLKRARHSDHQQATVKPYSTAQVPESLTPQGPLEYGDKSTDEWQEHWKEERKMHAKLKAEYALQERSYKKQIEDIKLDYEKRLFLLKKDNKQLATRLSGMKQKVAPSSKFDGSIASSFCDHSQLEHDFQQQEHLLLGYQQENEKIYNDLKSAKAAAKNAEEILFHENQKLSSEVVNLRAQLQQAETKLQSKGLITSPLVQREISMGNVDGNAVLGAKKITQLEAEVRYLKEKESELIAINKLAAEKVLALESCVDELKLQKVEVGIHTTGMSEKEKGYMEEIDKLRERLKWYAENQEMIDKDSILLKQRTKQLRELQTKFEMLERGNRRVLNEKMPSKRRSESDVRRIRDLESQVKDLETVLRKRNQDSIAGLVMAAASANNASRSDVEAQSENVAFLEGQLKKLQDELEGKDEDSKRVLRVMQQQFSASKLQYEDRIFELESLLRKKKVRLSENLETLRIRSLEQELHRVQIEYRGKIKELEDKLVEIEATGRDVNEQSPSQRGKVVDVIKALRAQLEQGQRDAESSRQQHARDKDTFDALVKRLEMENDDLTKQVSKLTVQAINNGRMYNPENFGSVPTDVLNENASLKKRIEILEQEHEVERRHMRDVLSKSEKKVSTSRAEIDDSIFNIRSLHKKEVDGLLRDNSRLSSKLSELQQINEIQRRKIGDFESTVENLRRGVSISECNRDELNALKISSVGLQAKVQQLTDDLLDARNTQTPEMKHYYALQEQVRSVERKLKQREEALRELEMRSFPLNNPSGGEFVTDCHLKQVVQQKNVELYRIQGELDKLLAVLHGLRKSGLHIPVQLNSLLS